MNMPKFFHCEICGNTVGLIDDGGASLVCCGKDMVEMTPNSVDASKEKHVPVIETEGNTVTVRIGSADHPMLEEHYIKWVYLLSEQGGQRKALRPGNAPCVQFALVEGDKPTAAYAFCNLHGLWVSTAK